MKRGIFTKSVNLLEKFTPNPTFFVWILSLFHAAHAVCWKIREGMTFCARRARLSKRTRKKTHRRRPLHMNMNRLQKIAQLVRSMDLDALLLTHETKHQAL